MSRAAIDISIRVGIVVTGPLWPEPLEVLATVDLGKSVKLVCKGLRTGLVRDPVLTQAQLAQLQFSPAREPFDGDAALFRPGRGGHPVNGYRLYVQADLTRPLKRLKPAARSRKEP